jgi:putative hydrolase of the HAD superfamily
MTRALVFDLDDTLFPERAYVASGFAVVDGWVQQTLGRPGFGAAAAALHEAGRRGRIFDEALQWLGISPTPTLVARLVDVYRAHAPAIALYPDVAPVLCAWQGPAAVVSDGPLLSQHRKAQALDLARRFHPVLLTDRWGRAFWKPHVRAFRQIEGMLGIDGPACVYVGDNPHKDFTAPRRLGWRTIRVRRPGGEHAAIDAPDAADVECASLEGLLELLG